MVNRRHHGGRHRAGEEAQKERVVWGWVTARLRFLRQRRKPRTLTQSFAGRGKTRLGESRPSFLRVNGRGPSFLRVNKQRPYGVSEGTADSSHRSPTAGDRVRNDMKAVASDEEEKKQGNIKPSARFCRIGRAVRGGDGLRRLPPEGKLCQRRGGSACGRPTRGREKVPPCCPCRNQESRGGG